jgi:hypothetical protein
MHCSTVPLDYAVVAEEPITDPAPAEFGCPAGKVRGASLLKTPIEEVV